MRLLLMANARDHHAATSDRLYNSAPIRGSGASRCSSDGTVESASPQIDRRILLTSVRATQWNMNGSRTASPNKSHHVEIAIVVTHSGQGRERVPQHGRHRPEQLSYLG